MKLIPAHQDDYLKNFRTAIVSENKIKIMNSPVINFDNQLKVDRKLGGGHNIRIPEQRLIKYSNCYLVGANSIIKDGKFYYRYSETGAHDLNRIANNFGNYTNDATEIFIADGAYQIDSKRLESPKYIKGKYLLITPDERDNWGIWLLVALPSIIFYIQNKKMFDGLVCYQNSEWMHAFIRSFGIEDEEILNHDIQKVYFFENLTVLSKEIRNLAVTDFEKHTIDYAVENFSRKPVSSISYEKIYVSRLKYASYRKMLNEDKLIERLIALGFTIFEPESYSLAEQIYCMNNAKLIIGPGGAGMFNSIFSKPGTIIYDIESSNEWIDSHLIMFDTCDLKYAYSFGAKINEDDLHSDWEINLDQVVGNIKKLIS